NPKLPCRYQCDADGDQAQTGDVDHTGAFASASVADGWWRLRSAASSVFLRCFGTVFHVSRNDSVPCSAAVASLESHAIRSSVVSAAPAAGCTGAAVSPFAHRAKAAPISSLSGLPASMNGA